MVINMENVKIYKSIVDNKIIQEIREASWCSDLFQYAIDKCKIDGMIAAAYMLCPNIIQVKDYIFIEKFWNHNTTESMEYIKKLEKQYDFDKKMIEMSVNSWSIGDLFIGDINEMMNNDNVLIQFGDTLVYFWKMRVRELFPNRNIVVETGHNLVGEFGLCITMYEEVNQERF